MEHAAPWLILAGSGGIADVLAALMHQPQLLVPQVAEKQLREKFPSEHFSREDILHWTALVRAAHKPRSGDPAPPPHPCPGPRQPGYLGLWGGPPGAKGQRVDRVVAGLLPGAAWGPVGSGW